MRIAVVRAIEERLVNAWPGLRTILVEDWCLRLADGYTKRANSASPIRAGALFSPAVEKAARRLYGRPACRRSCASRRLPAPDADARLADAGFTEEDPSFQMLARLPAPAALDPALRIESAPSSAWIAGAAADYGGDKADPEKLGAIVRLIAQPAAFASLEVDGAVVARGLAVRERGMVGLFDIVVAPEARGRGHGRRWSRG